MPVPARTHPAPPLAVTSAFDRDDDETGAKTDDFYATILASHPYALALLEACGTLDGAALASWLAANDQGEAPWPSSSAAVVEGVYVHYLLANRPEFLAWAAAADAGGRPKLARELTKHAERLEGKPPGTLSCMVGSVPRLFRSLVPFCCMVGGSVR